MGIHVLALIVQVNFVHISSLFTSSSNEAPLFIALVKRMFDLSRDDGHSHTGAVCSGYILSLSCFEWNGFIQ